MYSLGHIQPKFETFCEDTLFFATITLPKCHYSKPLKAQINAMDKLLFRICGNYFHYAYGAYELTLKGNIHAHVGVKLREHFNHSDMNMSVKLMSSLLKQFSNCDFQLIKNHRNVYDYIYKDTNKMFEILIAANIKASPLLSYHPYGVDRIRIEELKNYQYIKHVKEHVEFKHDCYYCRIAAEFDSSLIDTIIE